jgi:hypothetical protein
MRMVSRTLSTGDCAAPRGLALLVAPAPAVIGAGRGATAWMTPGPAW